MKASPYGDIGGYVTSMLVPLYCFKYFKTAPATTERRGARASSNKRKRSRTATVSDVKRIVKSEKDWKVVFNGAGGFALPSLMAGDEPCDVVSKNTSRVGKLTQITGAPSERVVCYYFVPIFAGTGALYNDREGDGMSIQRTTAKFRLKLAYNQPEVGSLVQKVACDGPVRVQLIKWSDKNFDATADTICPTGLLSDETFTENEGCTANARASRPPCKARIVKEWIFSFAQIREMVRPTDYYAAGYIMASTNVVDIQCSHSFKKAVQTRFLRGTDGDPGSEIIENGLTWNIIYGRYTDLHVSCRSKTWFTDS